MKTLQQWLDKNNMSLIEFEKLSGVPYQRISEHLRLGKPLSEEHVILVLKATKGEVSVESLRPKLKEIFDLVS